MGGEEGEENRKGDGKRYSKKEKEIKQKGSEKKSRKIKDV